MPSSASASAAAPESQAVDPPASAIDSATGSIQWSISCQAPGNWRKPPTTERTEQGDGPDHCERPLEALPVQVLADVRRGLAAEDDEDEPEGVDGCQERAERSCAPEDPAERACVGGAREDGVLREEPGEGRDRRESERADEEDRERSGSSRPSPPIFRMSCSPASAWMTMPAAMKSSALKKACVIRWKRPAL